MKRSYLLALVFTATLLHAGERAAFDSGGGLTSVIDHGAELSLPAAPFVEFTGGLMETAQPHEQKSPVTREDHELRWKGSASYPNGTKSSFAVDWTELPDGVKLSADLKADLKDGWRIDAKTVDYVMDLPRETFERGSYGQGTFPEHKPADPTFFRADTAALTFESADHAWRLGLELDQARPVTITDHWDKSGHVYRVRISLHQGAWAASDAIHFGLTLRAEAHPHAVPAHVAVDASRRLYPFDGFGGDYCFNLNTPVVDYMMQQLPSAWARLEFKAFVWDHERASEPGPDLKRDFELMARVQKTGAPWVLTLWRLPERFYSDPNEKPMGTFGRKITAERWPEFLDLLGSYLAYAKKHYGIEPTFFSFNEPDLGVDVGFSGETHRDAIKRIGAYFVSQGIKTKLLLGDTANPRDSHVFTLPTAADADAMQYVGAVSFHSWGNGTAQQYRSWRDVGRWLQLPLIVGEAGSDPGFYRNYAFDSYSYGLRDAEQYQHLLRDAEPTAIIYWQYTEDYGLVHVKADGTIEPTARFYLMKQFATLTPTKSEVVASESDQPDVFVSAFTKGDAVTVHILNRGAEREVTLSGLPQGNWREVTTTEDKGFEEAALSAAPTTLKIPARSMVSLVKAN